MVLNVLLCAGAVPLQPEERPQQRQVHPQQDSAEYVQFLEQLVGELSQVFSQWVHQNPPNASQMNDTRARNITRNTSRGNDNHHHIHSRTWKTLQIRADIDSE